MLSSFTENSFQFLKISFFFRHYNETLDLLSNTFSFRCLSSLNIYPKDTRDEQGRQRFLPWRPEQHYHADLTRSFIMDPVDKWGISVFHENLISMHHLNPDEIRLIHGMLYGVAQGIWKDKVKQV